MFSSQKPKLFISWTNLFIFCNRDVLLKKRDSYLQEVERYWRGNLKATLILRLCLTVYKGMDPCPPHIKVYCMLLHLVRCQQAHPVKGVGHELHPPCHPEIPLHQERQKKGPPVWGHRGLHNTTCTLGLVILNTVQVGYMDHAQGNTLAIRLHRLEGLFAAALHRERLLWSLVSMSPVISTTAHLLL